MISVGDAEFIFNNKGTAQGHSGAMAQGRRGGNEVRALRHYGVTALRLLFHSAETSGKL